MLSGPAEALTRLLRGEGVEGKGRITSPSWGIKMLRNGIKYFSVEVSFEDGVQYGISAYDEEATDLYMVAMGRYKSQEKTGARPIPLVAV